MIPDKFHQHVQEYLDEGYGISRIEPDFIEMVRRKRPPLTFLLYLLMGPIGWIALILNWCLGYKYTVVITDRDDKIEVKTK